MAVQRLYIMKRPPHDVEAKRILKDLRESLNKNISNLKILNRYDIEGLTSVELEPTIHTVFSEPMVDDCHIENYPFDSGDCVFAVEYLPGQFDQRSDSARQCVRVITNIADITIRCAKVYILSGVFTAEDIVTIKKFLINPVDQREAELNKPETLALDLPDIEDVPNIDGFITMDDSALAKLLKVHSLAMSLDDIRFSQDYFKNEEKRDPTQTELKLLDTYWSDHCRHTTFNTVLKDIKIFAGSYTGLFEQVLKRYSDMRASVYGQDSKRPITLMDFATIGAKYAKKEGYLDNLEVSEENNACSIEIDVKISGGSEKWLLQFKNETHNHPTEIEPYGGAATCLGGAIRDPLSGRAYVYQAMRISGSADPRHRVSDTIEGKLPQRKITKEAARGFSAYGNQIGLATGYVQEFYHSGFAAKRLEAGAVIGAVPKDYVRRETPAKGDIVILLGGKTGRDGIGGATGSSKEHDISSTSLCAAEVQKGNAPEEHKIQRFFRKPKVSLMIKKCNDFGAGGVGVAIGELADGLLIDLNAVPKKYAGLTGTEIAIAESQERMAVVIAYDDIEKFKAECDIENLEATVVAEVTDNNRLQMKYNDRLIVDISRKFLDSAGVERYQSAEITEPTKAGYFDRKNKAHQFEELAKLILSDLNVCSQKGLMEMFDSSIGGSTVLLPFGGESGNTPSEYMAAKIPVLSGDTSTISLMAAGYNPELSAWSPFHGGLYAVIESVSKLIAAGARLSDIRLSFQEYFEKLSNDPKRWGKPLSALLGALHVQDKLKLAAIGGKDSMSGTFCSEKTGELNVPPTLISFAAAPSDASRVVTPEFKKGGSTIYLLKTTKTADNIIDFNSFIDNANAVSKLIDDKLIDAIYTVKSGGIIEAVSKMAFGNRIGFSICAEIPVESLSDPLYGSFIIEGHGKFNLNGLKGVSKIGVTLSEPVAAFADEKVPLDTLLHSWSEPLEQIFPTVSAYSGDKLEKRDYIKPMKKAAPVSKAKPRIAILALPGTNCEYDTARAFELAGSYNVEPFIFRNRTLSDINESCAEFAEIIKNSQILAVPGGFSGGDEPEGSGKFYLSVFKNSLIKDAINELISKRDGLAIGICNGFQALIKTGLLTYGEIRDLTEDDATLSYNTIGRHVSSMVRTRVSSVNSVWMSLRNVGDIDIVPISHGEGRFTAPKAFIDKLFAAGQVLFQYVDEDGCPTMAEPFNPNGAEQAIEAICSPDGRVLGKMCHSERRGRFVHINSAKGNKDQLIFEAGVKYFL